MNYPLFQRRIAAYDFWLIAALPVTLAFLIGSCAYGIVITLAKSSSSTQFLTALALMLLSAAAMTFAFWKKERAKRDWVNAITQEEAS